MMYPPAARSMAAPVPLCSSRALLFELPSMYSEINNSLVAADATVWGTNTTDAATIVPIGSAATTRGPDVSGTQLTSRPATITLLSLPPWSSTRTVN